MTMHIVHRVPAEPGWFVVTARYAGEKDEHGKALWSLQVHRVAFWGFPAPVKEWVEPKQVVANEEATSLMQLIAKMSGMKDTLPAIPAQALVPMDADGQPIDLPVLRVEPPGKTEDELTEYVQAWAEAIRAEQDTRRRPKSPMAGAL